MGMFAKEGERKGRNGPLDYAKSHKRLMTDIKVQM
jgi:hypothetical protein